MVIVDSMLLKMEVMEAVNENVNVDVSPFVTFPFPLHSSDGGAVNAVIVPILV